MQEQWGSVSQHRCRNYRGLHSVLAFPSSLESRKFFLAPSPEQSRYKHERVSPQESISMGEVSDRQKPCSLLRELKETEEDWPEKQENSLLSYAPFKFQYDWITAWRQWCSQSCFSLRVYNDSLSQDNS